MYCTVMSVPTDSAAQLLVHALVLIERVFLEGEHDRGLRPVRLGEPVLESDLDLARLAEGAPGRALSLAASQSDDFYRTACALLVEPRFDMSAAASLCEKWGRGGAEGQPLRDGAIWLIGRLLRLSAMRAGGAPDEAALSACGFEEEAMARLVNDHGAGALAERYATFQRSASQMDGLYLDFGHFLSRELAALRGKSLP